MPSQPEARSEVETHLRRLFMLSLDLMCVAGFDGYFKRVNPAFQRVLGYDREELLSCQFVEFVHPDDRDKTFREVESLAGGAVSVDFENRYRTRDGDYRWLAWRAAPMVDRGLIYAVARDITQQKADRQQLARQARELARSNADLEQFAHVASHDLRAPLRSIMTLAGFIEQDLGDEIPPKSKRHLVELRRRGMLMEALTEDLLVYSQAGREREESVRVDTSALVREIVFLLDPPEAFEVVADDSLPVVETVRGPLRQVLRNLIANAVKHHDRGEGEVRVSARDTGDRWEFAVADDGPGIGGEDQVRVSRVFAQPQTDAGAEGWGMGLVLVQRVVERFGGRVWLDSGPGRGATFRFEWPKRIDEEPATQ